ncbi:TetR family transcriptional regulator [Streptosporangium sp. NPDC002524]|uniref:TetR/AcrR family transcriptional regulator n=1 Tax=Streptosporangium sp. NPDC002524 TaxID=3154537 RepID=UPI00332DB95D
MNQPARPRGRGGRPAVLTTERVVAAAVEVLDAEGLDALTMRRVGARLGVAAMSLYRHVPNRDALLAGVVNHLFSQAVAEPDPESPEGPESSEGTEGAEGPWAEALTRFAVAYRRTLLLHPRAVPLLATHPVDVDTGLTLLAGLLDRFAAAGVPREGALTAIQSVGVYVLGHALAQVGTPPGAAGPAPVADPAATAFYDHWFDAGLLAMVSGFERQLAG